MYKGEVSLPKDQLDTFFETAKSLQIKGDININKNVFHLILNFALLKVYHMRTLNQFSTGKAIGKWVAQ